MRAILCLLSCASALAAAALCGCSSDSSAPEQSAGMLEPPAGSGGTPAAGPAQTPMAPAPQAAAGAGAATPEGPPGELGLAGPNTGESGPTAPPAAAGGSGGGSASGSGGAGAASPPPMATGVCPPGPFAASPLPANLTPRAICTGMTFTEGAVWFQERNTLFFSDFQINSPATAYNGRILTYTPDGQCQEFIADTGTNGLAIAPDGNLFGASHADQTLVRFDLATRAETVLVAANAVTPQLNAPNDIAVRSDGNLYFTDPTFLLGGRNPGAAPKTYRRDPSGALTVIDTGNNPNGITLSPDEKLLYLSHQGNPNNVLVFDVDDAGAVSNSRVFISDFGSDGMAIDCAGNLYLTTGGVRVYNPQGTFVGTIPAAGAANVAFGGPERKTLFITATTSLLQLEMAIPGLPY